MRVVLAPYVFVLIGCAGAPPKPAESPSNDTASLESNTTPSTSAAAAAPAAKDSNPPASHDTAAASSGPSGPPAGPPAAFHPMPAATGSIDGKPFAPKLARISAPLHKDGR